MKPKWLEGTNLTRFDVPGLCNEIWVNSVGVACTDTDQMEGCKDKTKKKCFRPEDPSALLTLCSICFSAQKGVLGGGTAVNAGLWWKPNPRDWDTNFHDGWKSTDVVQATQRVFTRIPGVSGSFAHDYLHTQLSRT